MKNYNIFYKNKKLNSSPIKDITLNKMLENSKNNIVKLQIDSNVIHVPLNEIKIVKCIVV